jgi:phosphonate transport system substrate-binding protein
MSFFQLSPFIGNNGLLASDKIITFGVVPQQSSTRLAKKWVPLINSINKTTDHSLIFATAPDIPTFEKRLSAGEYDIAYMNPYHYTVYHDISGYKAFAKQANKMIKGIIIAGIDSEVKTIEDLNGRSIAFPAPAAFAATLLARSHLDSSGIKYKPKFVGSHDSVYRAVVGGFVTAGGGIYRTLNSIEGSIKDKLSILWESKGYTPHAFASHPRLEQAVITSIQNALIKLNESPEGISILDSLRFEGIESANDSDWDDIRQLKITAPPNK